MVRKLAFIVLALAVGVSAWSDYRFQVPENRSRVTVNTDASITIEYALTFANEGQPINVVDVGMPDSQYSLSDVRADLDGAPMTDIRHSEYVQHGVEVHLGDRAIPAGSSGTLHVSALVRNKVFPDRKDPGYASLEFSPTWYGAEFTSGTTKLVCEFVLPEGVDPKEPRYHERPFTSARVDNGRIVYTWQIDDASPSSQYTFGASFPKRVMSRLAKEPRGPGILSRIVSGIFSVIFGSMPCFMIGLFIAIVVVSVIKARGRRLQYLPPTVGMEGVEVRRGLTVPEVAVLMQEPVDKVMALLLFGMIRKGAVQVLGRSPLRLVCIPDKKPEFSYEEEFAKAVKDDGRIDEAEATKILTDLIKRVKEKMKGFSRAKTLAYYREIMRKAWDQVGKEDYSQAFEWLILDKDFDKTAAERFGTRPMPIPVWWVPMYVGHGSGADAPSGAPLPNPVAAANSIVSGIESFGHDLVNSVPGLATKVTQQTNPVPVSSGGGHSGGGCACACACAGCACACAGGGR